MAREDDNIRIRPGRVRDRGASRPVRVRQRPATFVGEVHQAIRREGGDPHRLAGRGKTSGRFNARGRGAKVAAGLKGRNGWSRSLTGQRTRSRRVAVKARIVKLNPQRGGRRGRQFVSAKAVDAHLRYLERDGVTRDSEKGQVYSAERDVEDGRAFLERGREDRHQFRFIVSAEEGVELSDLRQTTRDLMRQMESDLDTKLDWIAVDHHNTGHPHTHILLRGITDQGKALNIAGDYIAHGLRERASEIVTLELGRQTEQEVSRQLETEVHAERFTRLDRMLIAEQEASNEFADLRPDKDMRVLFRKNRALLIDRARHLERMGLATEVMPGRWTIAPKVEGTLRDLGTRGDIIKTMHRALDETGLADRRRGARYVMHGAELAEPVTGRVLSKGLGSDELGERMHLVIDSVDGRIHHMEVDAARAEEIGRGMIVSATPPPSTPRVSDTNILRVAGTDGIYSPSEHLEGARERLQDRGTDPETHVRMHVRRLEALRRAGIVERVHAEHWTIPADLPERGLAYDRKRHGLNPRITTLSSMPLGHQVTHDGATWLDRELTARQHLSVAKQGFGREVNDALDRRAQRLVDMGHATAKDGYINIPRKTVAVLERQEVERIGKALATERGRTWEPAQTGNYVMGTLVGSTQLASGRFAMIDDGLGFSLVPWSTPLEKQLGKHITGIAMPGGGVDWDFGRQRGLGR
jgi:type IV secretory pathway VirD2 relaxase